MPSRSVTPPPYLWLSAVFFPLALTSVALGVAQVFARMGIQRRWRAWLTDNVVSRWLESRSLLSAQPRRRGSQESGIPHRRRSTDCHRRAGRFHRRRHLGAAVRGHLHRSALDDRWRAKRLACRHDTDHSRFSRGRGGCLCGPCQHRDGSDRSKVCGDFGKP